MIDSAGPQRLFDLPALPAQGQGGLDRQHRQRLVIAVSGRAAAQGIIALLPLPLAGAIILMPLVGIGLNGTSSVLYGTVPELVAPARRTRAFGIFSSIRARSPPRPPCLRSLGSSAMRSGCPRRCC
jgi:MFS family permease